jgi:hypothetical protein
VVEECAVKLLVTLVAALALLGGLTYGPLYALVFPLASIWGALLGIWLFRVLTDGSS